MDRLIKSERLILKTLKVEDGKRIFKWLSDPRVSRFMPYPTYKKVEEAEEWIRSNLDRDKEFYFSVSLKASGEMVGNASIEYLEDRELWSFGYNFAFEYWNKGYATETGIALIDYVKKEFNGEKFGADCVVENIASEKAILKIGLKFSHYGTMEKLDGSELFRNKYFENSFKSINQQFL